jgi:hypothetical protein
VSTAEHQRLGTKKITRDDIESKLRELQGDVTDRVVASKQKIIMIAAGAGTAVLLLTYLIGRRAGRKKTTVVEIRRV